MTICPNCRRRNKRSSGDFIFFAVLAIVFLFCILIFYFIDTKVINKETYESYTQKCVLVSYEDLVRVPKKYLYSDVTLVGKVVEVTGANDGLYNSMNIVLDLNLFDDGYESLVNVELMSRGISFYGCIILCILIVAVCYLSGKKKVKDRKG